MANELMTKNDLFMMDDTGAMVIRPEAISAIRQIQVEYKDIKKKYEKFKTVLLEGMEEYGIKKVDTEDVLITYIESGTQTKMDKDRLWDEYKDVAFICQKEVPVKASVKITPR